MPTPRAAGSTRDAARKEKKPKKKTTLKDFGKAVVSEMDVLKAVVAPMDDPEPKRTAILAMASEHHKLFDAHCRYLSWSQTTEGIDVLLEAMESEGVGFAALAGCPFKKCWVDLGGKTTEEPPTHHLYDDGDLYFYSMTDALVWRDLQASATSPLLQLLYSPSLLSPSSLPPISPLALF